MTVAVPGSIYGDLFRALSVLIAAPSPRQEPVARALEMGPLPTRADHTEAFVMEVHPYGAVYLGHEGKLGGDACDRMAGFWRTAGLEPPVEPDHAATLLEACAQLALGDGTIGQAIPAAARPNMLRGLLWEHMASWMLPFSLRVERSGMPFYSRWALGLRATLVREIRETGELPDLPTALRESEPMPGPEAGAGAFFRALLAPVRSGMVLSRGDLSRAARTLRLGLRIGEREFILKAMLAQGPHETMMWLAGEGGYWKERYKIEGKGFGSVGRFWQERATNTQLTLIRLAGRIGQGKDPEMDLGEFAP